MNKMTGVPAGTGWAGIGSRLRRSLLMVLIGLCCLWFHAQPAHAALTDCAGQNNDNTLPGVALCTKPIPGAWSGIGICTSTGASLYWGGIQCSCFNQGQNDANLGCINQKRPFISDGDLTDAAVCFTNDAGSCGGTQANWSGWQPSGSVFTDNQNLCGTYQATTVQGVLISDYQTAVPTGMTKDANGQCDVPTTFIPMQAAKSRKLTCPDGYNSRVLADGVTQECWRFPACPLCALNQALGNIQPGDGSANQNDNDYPGGGGPNPVSFSRSYTTYPYYAAVQGADRGTYGFDTRWVSNYDAHVFTDPANPGLMATVQRGNGVVKNFDPSGNEIGAINNNEHDTLAAITDSGGNVTGWRYSAASGDQVETYNATGQLITRQNRFGLAHTLTYSDANTPAAVAPAPGLLLTVSDPFGRTLSFVYDASSRIVQMTDPAGGLYNYTYDDNGNLIQVMYPDIGNGTRSTRQYLYGETAYTGGGNFPNHLTGIIDENASRYATYTYNQYGTGISRQNAGGVNLVTYVYGNGSTAVTTQVGSPANPLFTTRSFQFANLTGIIKNTGIVDPNTNQPAPCAACGNSAATTYDANGYLASTQDWNGNLTCYTNDARGDEVTRVEGLAGGTCPGTPTAATRTTNTQWHATFHLPLVVAEPLRTTTYTYDNNGDLLTRSVQATSDATGAAGFGAVAVGSPRVWTYTYNGNGQVLTIDGPRTDVAEVTTYTYYDNADPDMGKRANVATVTNALGQTTQITAYNAHGQPLTIVDPNGLTTQLTYDGRQRLTSRNVGGELTTYTYDGVGQVTQVTLPDASSITYTYDGAHRLTGLQDNLGNSITYTLDLMGNRMQEQITDPNNALVQTRSRVYDAINRLQKDIGAQNQTTQYAYDAQGNLTAVTDPLSRVTTNSYDALNRLASMTQPVPSAGSAAPVIAYGYNGLDQLTQVTDPRSLVTRYAYDGLGNLNSQVSPDTGTTANTFDAAGNILTSTDAKSQVTSYTYDALNRVTSVTYNQATGTQLKTVAYAYDQGTNGVGRLTQATETAADGVTILQTTQYAYDIKGRLAQETRTLAGVPYVIAYAYNETTGRMTGMTYPSGRSVVYGFDALGRITQISSTAPAAQGGQTQVLVSSVAYQPFGGVKSFTLGNNQQVNRTYDQDGRIASYTVASTQYTLGYDAASRIVSILNGTNAANSLSYAYDNLDRLTIASLPTNASYAYNYDLTGNRLSRGLSGGGGDSYGISPSSNQISQISGNTLRNFSYDANGSTTADGKNLYAYDARGRMVQSQGAGGSTSYQVSAQGQRVRKTSQLVGDIVYLYDAQGKLITEATAAGVVKREYLYLLDIPVAVNVQQ